MQKWLPEPETRPFWTNAEDEVLGLDGKWHTSNKATIWRWRSAYHNDFAARMHRLSITHTMYAKGHPWENLIEAQFGIQARVGEYQWAKCKSVDEAVEIHRDLIRDHNRLPHFAHQKRQDQKKSPLEVLGSVRGREVDHGTLHRAFNRMSWTRRTDARGFVRIGRWRIYV